MTLRFKSGGAVGEAYDDRPRGQEPSGHRSGAHVLQLGAFDRRVTALTPLLMIVAGRDWLTPPELSIDTSVRAGEPKRLWVYQGDHDEADYGCTSSRTCRRARPTGSAAPVIRRARRPSWLRSEALAA